MDANPVRRVPLESEGEGRERYLTYAEEERLLPVLQGRLAHLRCPVIVAVDTGMRKTAELLRLQIEHVNFSDSPVFFNINGKDVEVLPDHLLVIKSKNKQPRTIPMTARVRSELLQVIQGRTDRSFRARGRASTSSRLRRASSGRVSWLASRTGRTRRAG